LPPPRERRDLASGVVMDEDRLIRFVVGPGGVVVPDLARKLPGRGLWTAATRSAVEQAAKGGFARAAKAKVQVSQDLAEQVSGLLARRLLEGLGLARRAGLLTFGFDKTHAAIAAGRVAWLIEASDGAADGRAKLVALARRQPNPPTLLGAFASGELSLALGLENVVHLAFLAGRGAERWTHDVHRLSGFRPLLPESWREEP
jgi:predicted RNA-binding protein YlxR (DUF448 family)